MFKHFLACLSLLSLIPMLAACGGTGNGEDSGADGSASPGEVVIRVSQGSDALSMDPYAHFESPTFAVHRNLYDPLTDLDANIEVQPCLAERWEIETPTTCVFHLRRDVRFHEGQPFTAEDAVFSIERAAHDPRSRLAPEIQTIASAEVIDDYTLRIHTRVPDAILPVRLAQVLMLNREWTEAGLAKDPSFLATHVNGTGAYRLAEWRKDERCLLRANEHYWGGAPEVAWLEFLPTSNEATRMAALQRGEIDILVNVPTRNVERLRTLPGYRVVERPSLRLIYLVMDTSREPSPGIIRPADRNPLRDPRVRRAIALGIDNALIVRAIMDGHAVPAHQLMPEGVTGHIPGFEFPRPDYNEAKRLLAEAGYPDGFALRLDGPNDRYVNDEQILQAVAQELARIGIEVTVNAQPKARFFNDERAGLMSFLLIGWSDTNGDGIAT